MARTTSHINAKRIFCRHPGCPKHFTRKGDMERHYSNAHNLIKAFKCTVPGCHYQTAQKSNLTTHEKVHTNQKDLHCRHHQQHLEAGDRAGTFGPWSDPASRSRHSKVCRFISADQAPAMTSLPQLLDSTPQMPMEDVFGADLDPLDAGMAQLEAFNLEFDLSLQQLQQYPEVTSDAPAAATITSQAMEQLSDEQAFDVNSWPQEWCDQTMAGFDFSALPPTVETNPSLPVFVPMVINFAEGLPPLVGDLDPEWEPSDIPELQMESTYLQPQDISPWQMGGMESMMVG